MSNAADAPAFSAWSNWKQGSDRSVAVGAGELSIRIGACGDLLGVRAGDIQISQYRPGPNDPGISGLWLRRRQGSHIDAVPLLGVRSSSRFAIERGVATWRGSALGVVWTVSLHVSGDGSAWAWRVAVTPGDPSAAAGTWDVASAQDVALAPIEQAMSSEPYISQYVAYHAQNVDGFGRVLAARQGMACAPRMPMLVAAFAEGARAHLTDGFDFYGREARMGGEPAALRSADWNGGRTNQYEFGMACLLSAPQTIADASDTLVFTQVNLFDGDYRGEMADGCARIGETVDLFADAVEAGGPDVSEVSGTPCLHDRASLLATASMLNGRPMEDDAFLALGGGEASDIETASDGTVLSYFGRNARHVVSQAKEMVVDRSHGQILLANGSTAPARPVMAATTYAPGVFASHIVLGNTNMNRLVSVHRTSLNLLRSQGVRLLVRIDGEWRLLGVPSAYVMDLGGSAWIYQLDSGVIRVETVASASRNVIGLHVVSDAAIDVIVTVDIESPEQWDAFVSAETPESGAGVVFAPAAGSPAAAHCPNLRYVFASDRGTPSDDAPLFAGHAHGSAVITFAAEGVRELRVAAAASDNGVSQASELAASALGVRGAVDGDGIDSDTDAVLAEHYRIISAYADDLQVRTDGRLAELNRVVPWFVQNALVHFLSPHGLEQYSGAAWGTRDVCQGPFELALAFGHFDTAREIILGVLRHQNPDGSLPQWFMFDEYRAMYQHDSHGDIPVWPLMAVGEYLEATGDTSILGDTAPYWDEPNGDYSAESHTVCDHLLSILSYIRAHRVPGTELFSYGEGDWDDTLQPAQASMKKEMASTWTIALLYQATRRLGELLRGKNGCEALSDQCSSEASTIRGAFTKDFIFDDVLAGYVSFTDEGPKPVIHPDDTRTGITYRLIPMTRSIIAGLLDDEETRRHEAIIDEHLHYPDGVRLMNRPAAYHDGVTTVFKRGEQAANVGREIGLMYTHAHIRYTEALAALGRDSVAEELLRISPVGQFRRLSTSEPRQRNCYFASSDADFPTRYDAAGQWDRLRADAADPVGVRGGWRVYSSGPGIYLRQVMQHVFGLSVHADGVVIDPLLAMQDDGTEIAVTLFGKPRTIRYRVVEGSRPVAVEADGRAIDGERLALRYRDGGLLVSRESLGDSRDIVITLGTAPRVR